MRKGGTRLFPLTLKGDDFFQKKKQSLIPLKEEGRDGLVEDIAGDGRRKVREENEEEGFLREDLAEAMALLVGAKGAVKRSEVVL